MQKYQNFYFHSVRFDFKTLESILKNGYILSREKAGIKQNSITFNGQKWISICKYYEHQYLDKMFFRSAFQSLVVDGLSIVLDENIDATKTLFIAYDELYPGLIKEENPIRYSDCIDEYQVRDSISNAHFLGILYPYVERLNIDNSRTQLEYDYLISILKKYNYDLPILDSSYCMLDQELDKLEKGLEKTKIKK